ncbi:MAG: valine--tRNA ligase, partial [Syntrophomonadaceae bacterium]|nr:valine--tRNA ligase [Syntrophomonadaceae bacterium]
IVMPPPNVTGQLHLGHALDIIPQDILIRWRRMQGFDTLWVPGTDHAGIATQAKVEEALAREGLTRNDLGREKFIERVWEWKELYGHRISEQLALLGSSCDWTRERFTMDEGCSRAVREVFVSLYEKGLIYQGNYITNWCPKCNTAISDIEVEHQDEDGNLWYIRYPVEDSDEYVVVATTRPETMLGDTGVAVHPEDERYRHLIGRLVRLPLVDRLIPIFSDHYVDRSFGTGAVKVTPAHDPNDFEMGIRNNLEQVVVMENHAVMNENAGKYAGMSREECRIRVVEDLIAQGYLVKEEKHQHAVGHCQRCNTIIEPLISKQWFVKMKPLAKPAMEKVIDGQIRFIPERFTKIYLNWMENIRDWCISRQLWWGHRIPVWYCQECGEVICRREDPDSCHQCGSSQLKQDEDVLDTWFSSALWPFSTLGWPEQTDDLKRYYPTSVLVTGRDIIFFWVARMIFSGIEHTGTIPFNEVNIHGLILDSQGRKMSKSLGNGIDPIEVIEKYGADTLRFSIITGVTPGNDVRFYWDKVENTRNFANKIWNASRFVLLNLKGYQPVPINTEELSLVDQWILSRLNTTVDEVNRLLERYDFGDAARVLYDFIWDEFCDWYIELAKPRLFKTDDTPTRLKVQNILVETLITILRTLHPFMPFITEEIYQHLPGHSRTIMLDQWPRMNEALVNKTVIEKMEMIITTIRALRNIRAEFNIQPGTRIKSMIQVRNSDDLRDLQDNRMYIEQMAGIGDLKITAQVIDTQHLQTVSAVTAAAEIYVPLEGIIDVEKEIQRLEKELRSAENDLKQSSGKLTNPNFIAKAPPEVVEKEKVKAKEAETRKEGILRRLTILKP